MPDLTHACLPQVLYHGTPEPFSAFRAPILRAHCDRGAGYNHQGPGVYLTSDSHGYARFFARESGARLAYFLHREGLFERSNAVSEGCGVVLHVRLDPAARIGALTQASPRIRKLFERSVGRPDVGLELRQAVLAAGLDGLAFEEPNFPEGWEVRRGATTVVLYRHELAHILRWQDARDLKLAWGWSEAAQQVAA